MVYSYFFGYAEFTVKIEFTTEARSSQSSENFFIKNSLLCALSVSAVQSPGRTSQENLKSDIF